MKKRARKKAESRTERLVAAAVSGLDRTLDRMANQAARLAEHERVMEHLLLILTVDADRQMLAVDNDLCPYGSWVIHEVEKLLRLKNDGDNQARQ